MKIIVIAKTNQKKEGVVKNIDGSLVIFTKKPAIEHKANMDIIRQLAEHLKISKSNIALVLGKNSKKKVFEIK